jgi:hypothetical protein
MLTLPLICALISACFAAPAPQEGGKQQVATLREYSLGGRHNVRYETVPVGYKDASGNPVSGRVGASANCYDMQGHERKEGEEYQRANGKFVYKCKSGNEEVIACVATDRANKQRVAVGQTLDVNGFWHKCETHSNGSTVYTEQSSCSYGGKEFKPDEEITVGNLRLKCKEHGYEVVGCFINEGGQHENLEKGQSKLIGNQEHFCEEKDGTLQYYAKRSGCTKAGKEYKEGEEFTANHLKYKCTGGAVDIVGCLIDDARPLNVGQDIVEKNMVYRCYRVGGRIEYTEYACGYNQTPSCTPAPIPETPDDVPALGKGLKSPGFGAFSVVESSGGKLPDLQLDKELMAKLQAQAMQG